jgi:hypothetical protein
VVRVSGRGLRSLSFFNPIALWFDRQLDEWREVACDRDVIEDANISRRAYATTLLELGLDMRGGGLTSAWVALLRNKSNLKRRVSQMKASQTNDRAIKGIVLGALIAATFVVLSCSRSDEPAAPVSASGPDAYLVAVAERMEASDYNGAHNALVKAIREYPDHPAVKAAIHDFKKHVALDPDHTASLHTKDGEGQQPEVHRIDEQHLQKLIEVKAKDGWTVQDVYDHLREHNIELPEGVEPVHEVHDD